MSHILIDAQAQTPAQPVYSESIDELFANYTTIDLLGDGETVPHEDQAKSTGEEARSLEGDKTTELKDEESPMDQE